MGCTDSDDVVVSSTPEPTLTESTNTPVSCNGATDGAASVQASEEYHLILMSGLRAQQMQQK